MNKYLLMAAGLLALSTGIIGIFLPVLPTTPFILLSAACFLKSSKSLYNWLVSNRLFGKYIENYIKYRAVSIGSKIVSIILLWAVITISILLIGEIWLKILLGIIAVAVTIHLLLLKTMLNNKETIDEKNN